MKVRHTDNVPSIFKDLVKRCFVDFQSLIECRRKTSTLTKSKHTQKKKQKSCGETLCLCSSERPFSVPAVSVLSSHF